MSDTGTALVLPKVTGTKRGSWYITKDKESETTKRRYFVAYAIHAKPEATACAQHVIYQKP